MIASALPLPGENVRPPRTDHRGAYPADRKRVIASIVIGSAVSIGGPLDRRESYSCRPGKHAHAHALTHLEGSMNPFAASSSSFGRARVYESRRPIRSSLCSRGTSFFFFPKVGSGEGIRRKIERNGPRSRDHFRLADVRHVMTEDKPSEILLPAWGDTFIDLRTFPHGNAWKREAIQTSWIGGGRFIAQIANAASGQSLNSRIRRTPLRDGMNIIFPGKPRGASSFDSW